MANKPVAEMSAKINLNSTDTIAEAKKIFADMQQIADSEKIVFKVSGDEKTLKEQIKKVEALDPTVKANIEIVFDSGDLQKQLKQAEDLAGKSAKDINKRIRESIVNASKFVDKINLDNVVRGKESGIAGVNESPNAKFNKTNAIALIKSLEDQTLKFNANSVNTEEEIYNQVKALKVLKKAKIEASKKNFLDTEINKKNLQTTTETFIKEAVDSGSVAIAKNLENYTNTIRAEFERSQELVKKITKIAGKSLITKDVPTGSGTGTGTGDGDGTGFGSGGVSSEDYNVEIEKVKDLQQQLDLLTEKESEAQSSVKSLTDNLDKQTEKTKELADELKKYAIEIEQINSTEGAKIVPSEYITQLTDDVTKLTNKLKIAKKNINNFKRQRDNAIAQKQEISEGKVVSTDEYEKANRIIDCLTDESNTLAATIKEIENQIIETSNKMSQMINIADMTEADKILQAQVEERKKNIESLEKEARARSEKIISLKDEANAIEENIKENKKLETIEIQRLNKVAERYSSIVREMNKYKNVLTDTKNTSEKRYAEYLDAKKQAETTGSKEDVQRADKLLKSAAGYYKKALDKGYVGGIQSPTGEDVSEELKQVTIDYEAKQEKIKKDAVTKQRALSKKINDLTLEKAQIEATLAENREQFKEYNAQLGDLNEKGRTFDEAKKKREELAKAKIESNKQLKEVQKNIADTKADLTETEKKTNSVLDKVKAAMSKYDSGKKETKDASPTKAKPATKTPKSDISQNDLVNSLDTDYYVEAIVIPKIHPEFKEKVKQLLGKEKITTTVDVVSEDVEKTVANLDVEQSKVRDVIEEFKLLNAAIDESSVAITQHKLSMTTATDKEIALVKEVIQSVELLSTSIGLIKPIMFGIEGLENIGKIQESIGGYNIKETVTDLGNFAVTVNNLGTSLSTGGVLDSLRSLKLSLGRISTVDLSSLKNFRIKQDAFAGLSSLNSTDVENFDKFVRTIRKVNVIDSLAKLSGVLKTADFSNLSSMALKKGAFDAINDITLESITNVEKLAKALEGFNTVNPINKDLLKGISLGEGKANIIGSTASNILDLSYALETLTGVNKSIASIQELTTEIAKLKGVVKSIDEIKVTYTTNKEGDITSTKVTDKTKEVVATQKELDGYYKKSIANIKSILDLQKKMDSGKDKNASEARMVKLLEDEYILQKEINSLQEKGIDTKKLWADITAYQQGAEADAGETKRTLFSDKSTLKDENLKTIAKVKAENFVTADEIKEVQLAVFELKEAYDKLTEPTIQDLDVLNEKLDEQINRIKVLTLASNKLYVAGKGNILAKPSVKAETDEDGNQRKKIINPYANSGLTPEFFGTEEMSRQRKQIQIFLEEFEKGKVILGNFSSDYTKMAYTVKTQNGMIKNMSLGFDALEGTTRATMESEKEWVSVGEKLAKSFKAKFVSMLQYISGMDIFIAATNAIRQGVASIKELDTAMTSLTKVTTASQESLLEFKNTAHEIAQSISSTTTAVIEAAAEWSRLGYTIKQVEELSKTTAVYVNVGGGLDAQTATQDIVSAMKAFDIQAEDSMKVVDRLNEVGNNYAASSEQLGEILQKSSSTLAVSGDSLDQVIAMGAAMNTILQDASTTGSTLKVLSLRLRGAKTDLMDAGEETETMAESTSKLREKIMALTNTTGKGGFDIMVNDKEFKTTYDIMKGISTEWTKMSNVDQAALLELIAGKNRAQGAAALIKNFSTAEDALQSSLNSQGSALKENETYMKSIAGQMEVLKSKWQEIWDNEETKKAIILVIKIGEALLDLTEKVGLFQTTIGAVLLGGGLFVAFSAFNIAFKSNITIMGGAATATQIYAQTLRDLKYEMIQTGIATKTGLSTGLSKVKETMSSLFSVFMKLPIQIKLVVIALVALAAAYAAIKGVEYKQKQDLKESIKTYDEAKDKIQEYTDELENTRKAIKELQDMGVLTFTQEAELEALKKQNTELERKLLLEKQIADAALEETVKGQAENYEDYKKDYQKDNNSDFDLEKMQKDLEYADEIKNGYTVGDYQATYNAIKATALANKADALKQAQDIQSQVDNFEAHIDAGNVLTAEEQTAYEAMKSDIKDIYNIVLTDSEKLVMKIQPVFDKAEFEGKYDEMMSYFLGGGSTNIEALRKKFGDDLITALEAAAKDAGMTLPEVISSMYGNAMNAENTFAPIIATPSSKADVEQNQVSAAKKKWFETLPEEEQAPIISGELVLTVDDSLAACKEKLHNFVTNAEDTEISLTFTASLDTAKTDFEKLNQAYTEATTGTKRVDVSSLDALSESFGKLDGYNDFINVLTDVNSTTEQTQEAFNSLATTYIDQSGILDTLTNENSAYASSQLKLMGVTNATDVIEGKLTEKYGVEAQAKKELISVSETLGNAKYNEANADNILANSSQSRILAMINEGNAAGQTTVALQKLLLEKIKAKGLTLKTDGDIQNLIALAKAAGASTEALSKYAQVKAIIARMGTYTGSGTADTEMLKSLESQIKAQIYTMLHNAGNASNSGGGGVTYSPSSTDTSGGGGGGGGGADTKTITPELYDWIEVAITRLEETITRLGKTVSNVYTVWSKRNKALGSELATTKQEIATQQEALNIYSSIAAGVTLSEDYKAKIRNGQMTVDSVSDEETKTQIANYQKWYGLVVSTTTAIDDLTLSLSELAKQKFDNIGSEFEQLISLSESQQAQLNKSMEIVEAQGYKISESFYTNLISIENNKQSQLKAELAGLQGSLAESVNNGSIEQGSEAWIEMQNKINDVSLAIQDSTLSVIEFNNEIRQLKWDAFDEMQDSIAQVSDEADFLIDLLSNDKLFTDGGDMTDVGKATLGLYAQNYNTYMLQAQKYATELKSIQASLAADPSNQTLIARERELIEAQREVISSAEDEKQAMIDLEAQGIQLQIDAMQELIDKKKESLDAEQSLYEYQKSIAEKTKAIAALQKQQTALSGKGADTEENRAKIQSIKLQLEEAKTDLADTERQKNIEDQQKMLDDLMTNYSDLMNAKLDDVQLLMKELIDRVNNNAKTIGDTITKAATESGYTLTSELKGIWTTGGIENAVSLFSGNFEGYATSVISILQAIATTVTGEETPTMGKKDLEAYDAKASAMSKYIASGDSAIVKLFEQKSIGISNGSLGSNMAVAEALNEMVSSSVQSLGNTLSSIGAGNIQNDVSITLDMPNVTDYNTFVTQLQRDTRFENIVKAMTVDQLSGKNTLTKLKY